MEKEARLCRRCRMPLDSEEVKGTEANGSVNEDYCIYCYKDGAFIEFCQSCGMPLGDEELKGTKADGSPSGDYCIYCYKDGAFTADCTMEEMIERCLSFMEEFNRDAGTSYTPEQAREEMRKFFPQLKRWRTEAGD